MPSYRRALVPGASWFFTVNLLQRRNNDLLIRHVDTLREALCRVHRLHLFTIKAWVVLPEHMHCVWALSPGNSDYSLRWRLIKAFFCRALPADKYRSTVRLSRGERGVWQRRYWEHLIRGDEDCRRLSTICTSIRSSMVWFVAYGVGLMQAFMAMCGSGCIRPIARGMLRCLYGEIDPPVFGVLVSAG